jgi:predicted nucleic acid-binding protein
MSERAFIDTNIFVYAHLQQEGNPKCDAALALIENLPTVICSTQVLNEYYSAMLKNKVLENLIQDNVEQIIEFSDVTVVQIKTLRSAHQFRLKYRFSYWDCLILASAVEMNCAVLYSEDMQHGQVIDGVTRIVNPFEGFSP